MGVAVRGHPSEPKTERDKRAGRQGKPAGRLVYHPTCDPRRNPDGRVGKCSRAGGRARPSRRASGFAAGPGAMAVRWADQYRRPRGRYRRRPDRGRHDLRGRCDRRRVEKHGPGRSLHFDLAGGESAVDGGAGDHCERDFVCRNRRGESGRRKHHLRGIGYLPIGRRRRDLATCWTNELWRDRPHRGGSD